MNDQYPSFYGNLIEQVDPRYLGTLGEETVELITDDDDSRAIWKRIVKDCTDFLGMSKGRPNAGQTMPKDTNIYGPTLRKSVLTMSSKIHQTLFPAGSFVHSNILGESNAETEDRAKRIEDWFNYYLFEVLKGYKSDKDLLILWYTICGSAFSKAYIDPVFQRPIAPYIHPNDLIISPDGSCLEDAERITHQFEITDRDYQSRVRSGMYREERLEQSIDIGDSIQAHAKARYGIKASPTDEKNKIYTFYECMRWASIPGLEEAGAPAMLPYVITVEKNSAKVLRIQRNYDPTDHLFNRKNPYTQYKLFPGFGPYGMGMAHLALDLAKAETQTMNELIRAAELSNQPSLFYSSGSIRKESTQIQMSPGSINRIDAIDGNVNNAISPLPTKEPSSVLFQLMQSFGQNIQDISAIRELTPENVPANATATTMMGILSTMHIMEDSVINRLYDSFKNELGLFNDLFAQWIPEEPYPFSVLGGEQIIMRNDFNAGISVIPIIDPNVSSQTFHLIANETLLGLAATNPDLYDIRAVHEKALRSMRISGIDAVLKPVPPPEPPPPPPPQIDPVTENQKIMKGEPVQAYKAQDHQSHITVHGGIVEQLTADPAQATALAALQAHLHDHQAFLWANEIQARMQMQIPEDPTQIPPEFQDQIAQKAAEATLSKQQEQQAATPPPPLDPSAILIEELKVKQAQLEEQRASHQQKFELDRMKVTNDIQIKEREMLLRGKELEQEDRKLQMEARKEEMHYNIEYAKLKDKKEQVELEVQNKAFDSTLKFESSKKDTESQHSEGID
jgi:hypothetical protein